MGPGAAVARINLWSLPRCASTASMYAFAQRRDADVFDEPLYCAFLAAHPELHRPYREELMASGTPDANEVVRNVILGPARPGRPVRLYKHIVSQAIPSMNRDFLGQTDHYFLVRHPYQVIRSYFAAQGSATVFDTGLPRMVDLYSDLERIGYKAMVVENTQLLDAPERVLREICARFGIAFDPSMLSWPAGGIPQDGLWASHWYKGTHATTGFGKGSSLAANGGLGAPPPRSAPAGPEAALEGLPANVRREAELCLPLFEWMAAKAKPA